MTLLTRRLFLQLSGQYLAAVSLVLASAPRWVTAEERKSILDPHETETLRVLVHDLFPHKDPSDEIYSRAVRKIEQRLNGTTEPLVHEGLQRLDQLAGGGYWLDKADSRRIALLNQIQTTPFFELIRGNAVETIYRDNATWKFLGYGGSSIEYGGYLHRGFDDIDWLPAVN